MKKLLYLIAPLLLIILVSCGGSDSKVVISKLYGASSLSNNVIELYNNSDDDVDLKNYKINIYSNGSTTVTKTVDVKGTIKANDFFVISGSDFGESDYESIVDFKHSENLPYNGDDVIELAIKDKRHDLIGNIGVDVAFSKDLTLIRIGELSTYQPQAEFYEFNFINYGTDLFKYLKNDDYEIKTFEQLLEGPRLDQRYKDAPFMADDNINGAGGAVLSTLVGVADGDTSTLKPVTTTEGFDGSNSIRYYYIDTPETKGPNTNDEPWGHVASKYNKQYLLTDTENRELRFQSTPGGATSDTYGRYLGLVWVNDELSQFLIVREGLSMVGSANYDALTLALTHKDIPYLTYLKFAEENAKLNGWGVHGYPSNPDGEKAPDWDYANDENKTKNPEWEPHFELNW